MNKKNNKRKKTFIKSWPHGVANKFNYKKFILPLVFAICATLSSTQSIHAQQNEIDSLWQELRNLPKKDTSYVKLFNTIIFKYHRINADTAIILAEQCLNLSKEIQYKKGEADALNRLGTGYFGKGDYAKAIAYFEYSRDIHQAIDDKIGEAASIGNIGNCYDSWGMHTLALRYLEEATGIFLTLKDSLRVAVGYYNIGSIYNSIGNFDKEAEYFFKSLKWSELINDRDGVAWAYEGLYNTYKGQGDLDKAVEMIEKALTVRKEMGYLSQIGMDYYKLGHVYRLQSMFDKSTSTLQKALRIFKENGFKKEEAMLYQEIGSLYNEKKEYILAEKYHQKAITIYKGLNNKGWLSECYKHLALNYMSKGEYSLAKDNFMEALKIARLANKNKTRLDILQGLYRLDSIQHHNASALKYYQQFKNLEDSLFSLNKETQIQELTIQYETEKKEQEIESLKTREVLQSKALEAEKTQKLYFGGSAVMASTVVILMVLLYTRAKKNKQHIESQNKELSQLNATKNRFFGIIAHDIRGPLTALHGITNLLKYHVKKGNEENLDKIATQIENSGVKVSALLDNLLMWALSQEGAMPYQPQRIALKPIVTESISYFREMALAKEIEITVNIAEEISIYADEDMLGTIFRNLISNSIKFTPHDGKVSVSAKESHDEIKIEVQDNGKGMSEEKLKKIFLMDDTKITPGTNAEKGTGLGLILVHDFIKVNRGTIQVNSKVNQGTVFSMTLPSDMNISTET